MLMTKREAVQQLIDGAIRAEQAGEEACVIALAGAAEGAMPEPADKHLFQIARDAFMGQPNPGMEKSVKNQVVGMLNAERDWLKHHNHRQPETMDLKNGLMSIMRAMSKFHAVYGREAETPTMQDYFAEGRKFDPHDG